MSQTPFKSFWMAGYECSDQLNHYGDRVDLLTLTGHIDQIEQDYELLAPLHIATVREGIRWSVVEKQPYDYDFSTVAAMLRAGKAQNIQQIWDICHFGYPIDLSPLHPHFARRFVALCEAFVRFYRSVSPEGVLIITPINEVGFISWLGGDHASTTPYCRGMGWDVKYSLVRAYIQGIKAMKAIDPNVLILSTEPIVNIVPRLNASAEDIKIANDQHNFQYQALDMLTGKICPELGGQKDLIDYMGFNFYYNNQWISNVFDFLPWANLDVDPRWRGLSSLLLEAYQRYGQPIVLAETSHSGEHRPNWLELITKECIKAVQFGVPLKGICLYPIIDRPDWDHLHNWHHSGLWDADESNPGARWIHKPYEEAILESQYLLAMHLS
ncbi:MAG: amine oxidase [Pedobacter sp.]|nr:MAG: amine oxidase [Pedobacter sp.]